jgi:hypothetical protein
MSVEDEVKKEVFGLLKEFVTDGWSNQRIREFLKDGI